MPSLPLISLWGKGDSSMASQTTLAKPAKASKAFSYFTSYRHVCRTITIQTPITENPFDGFAKIFFSKNVRRDLPATMPLRGGRRVFSTSHRLVLGHGTLIEGQWPS
jgi:hypothetical protein